MKLAWVMLVLIGLLALTGGAVSAAQPPAIVVFSSSVTEITLAEVESGSATTTLSWQTANLTADYRLTLHAYVLDRWQLVFPAESVPLEAGGARVVTIQPPLNFGPPTFLLTIARAQTNSVVDQRVLTIPYAAPETPLTVETFSTTVTSLDAVALAAGQVQVPVEWRVENRPPGSNLVFEQVFADATAASVELPRPNLWIVSSGSGPLAPVYRGGETGITLRLSVVDLAAGTVLAESTIDLPITGTAPAPVPTTPPPAATLPPAPTPQQNEIAAFSATPTTVNRGAAVTLAWEVRGTGGVTIEQFVPGTEGSAIVVNAASPKGSAEVYLPPLAAYEVRFVLYTLGRTSQAEATVSVYCPQPFFFGEGDGCPTGAAQQINATFQAFEGGNMIWRPDTGEIYVFYGDGLVAYFLAQDYTSLPEPQVAEAPPLDRQIPSGGFGKVWANAPGVRSKLGWALQAEQGYSATYQAVSPTRDPQPPYYFYLTMPEGGLIIGAGSRSWQPVTGQPAG